MNSYTEFLYRLFEYSLGAFDVSQYCYPNINDQTTCTLGKVMIFIFLLVNAVLILNFIIAILSSTYAYYENKKLGLYYSTLVSKFSLMQFDEKYGAICCAPPILNLILVVLWPISFIPCIRNNEEILIKYNYLLCYILYLPIAITFTVFFMVIDACLVPLAYFK